MIKKVWVYLLLLPLTLSSCLQSPYLDANQEAIPLKEDKRLSSPDKKVDAVLTYHPGGHATAPDSMRVYIVRAGKNIRTTDEQDHYSMVVLNGSGLDISWKKDHLLVISYDKAKIISFQNSWHSSDVENWNYVVELLLKPTTPESQLSERDFHPGIKK